MPAAAEGGVHSGAGAAEEAVLGRQGGRHRGQLLPPVCRRSPPVRRRRGGPPAGQEGAAAGRGEVTTSSVSQLVARKPTFGSGRGSDGVAALWAL